MPSDPSGTSPKGVLVKPAPDFFDDHLACGGYQIIVPAPAGNNFVRVQLYNNARSGVVFKVYAVSVSSDAGGGGQAWVDASTALGTFVAPCSNIRADQGAPYGQIYQSLINQPAALPNPFTVPAGAVHFGAGGFDSATHISTFPFFIVPVGFALNVVNIAGAAILGASFWYQQANE